LYKLYSAIVSYCKFTVKPTAYPNAKHWGMPWGVNIYDLYKYGNLQVLLYVVVLISYNM